MNPLSTATLVIIPIEELNNLKTTQQQILQKLTDLSVGKPLAASSNHITAKEFMSAVKICRSKFDQLVISNKIKTVKKRRKIYVPVTEVDRYFTDPSIL